MPLPRFLMNATCRPWLLACVLGWVTLLPALAAEPLRLAAALAPLSLPVYVAEDQKYFAAEGLDVQISDHVSGRRCLLAMFDNRADVATVADLPIAYNGFDRIDFAIIATFVSSTGDMKLVARGGGGITGPLSLAGARVGVTAGSSGQYFLEMYLLAAGVDPRGLTQVALQPEDMVAAMTSAQVDAIAIWEPYGYLASKALGKSALVMPPAPVYTETFNLVVPRKLLAQRDADVVSLLRAIERAEKFIRERPDEAKAILIKRLKLDRPFVDWVWPSMAYRLSLDQALLSTLESQARWAVREGHIKGKTAPNYLGLVHTRSLLTVKPTAVGISH